MDKYDLVLDIIVHPDKYSSEQLAEIMSEPETREIYNLLCKTESAIKDSEEPDVSSEWEKFSDSRLVRSRRVFSWFGNRAASIAAIVGSSIVAVAAGIAVTVSVIDHKSEPFAENTAAVAPSAVAISTDTIATKCDTVNVYMTPVMFENEPLEKIMNEVAKIYRVEVKFKDENVASLHLYYKLDPSLTLNDVIEQLNTFEQINIRRNGNTLIID